MPRATANTRHTHDLPDQNRGLPSASITKGARGLRPPGSFVMQFLCFAKNMSENAKKAKGETFGLEAEVRNQEKFRVRKYDDNRKLCGFLQLGRVLSEWAVFNLPSWLLCSESR